ncbi:TPA: phage major tail tube protein [Burkholderia vietnamiensis]|uniref:phage major tail tube protein n=1 Tax=Burkholderia sp. SR8 TaxID=3062277 RepID=UPI00330FAF7D|nr:phage major tail tube protein [Burkholderia vietnamiensis]
MVPETLTNMALYVDGRGFAGRATEVSPPKLKIKTEDYRAGGMDAPVKIDQGMEGMQAAFSMGSVERDVLKYFGLADNNAFNATFRGAFRDTRGKVKSVVLIMRGMLSEFDPGSWKPGSTSELKYTADLTYYKAEIDGAVICEIDVLNMIRIIDGVDQLADVRKALGM